ncbi:OsmC family peroxiredoxin [Pelagicoccus sp. SDUM812002]|uniref:OsmC family peroxiredoxin n=1 Tax=Pelagicoccus sp. SDUM812002 TaxID=3041266 RepID=UPI00280F386E|nr:OsmC family peroxiredoxin [Pelagicoccus sp. SDUM812002]MDQ8187394.1 OsmC family peroxiredoxin [Pelagicoccus sp. SDUM812002]
MSTMTTVMRAADATWNGDAKGGHGFVSVESGVLNKSRYSLSCRLDEGDRSETNPEELIAGAAASCFAMALSNTLSQREKVPTELVVRASVGLEVTDSGPSLKRLELKCEGLVPAATTDEFESAVAATQKTCPVFLALKPGFESVDVSCELRH